MLKYISIFLSLDLSQLINVLVFNIYTLVKLSTFILYIICFLPMAYIIFIPCPWPKTNIEELHKFSKTYRQILDQRIQIEMIRGEL